MVCASIRNAKVKKHDGSISSQHKRKNTRQLRQLRIFIFVRLKFSQRFENAALPKSGKSLLWTDRVVLRCDHALRIFHRLRKTTRRLSCFVIDDNVLKGTVLTRCCQKFYTHAEFTAKVAVRRSKGSSKRVTTIELLCEKLCTAYTDSSTYKNLNQAVSILVRVCRKTAWLRVGTFRMFISHDFAIWQ